MEDPDLPVVPVLLNTYFPPTQPTPRRCYKLGQAIRAAVESYPGDARIGIVGSGGLSHFVVDEALDRGVIDACRRKDAAALQSLPRKKLNSGSSEIRMWICVGAASSISTSNGRAIRPATGRLQGPAPGSASSIGRETLPVIPGAGAAREPGT